MATISNQVFVSFSGETSKVSVPITTVLALSIGAKTGSVIGPATDTIQEARGMAQDARYGLYVAQSYKKATAIRCYGPVAGSYPMTGTDLVVQGRQPQPGPPLQSPALLHPYGLAFDPQTTSLYQSSQDTNVVSGYSLGYAGATVTATALPTSSALAAIPNGTFYEGQYVTSSVPLAVNPGITLLPQTAGGLGYTDGGSAHSVRGIAVAGTTLYVVDEAAALVGTYDLRSGAFTGWITTNGTSLTPMSAPVGIVADSGGNVYIGDSGNDTIYKWSSAGGPAPTALSVFAAGNELKKISGLAVLPDGSLIFGSREPVTAGDAHGGNGTQTYSIYRIGHHGGIDPWATGFTDTPECLLCVGVVSS
jgi:hypothetical protein